MHRREMLAVTTNSYQKIHVIIIIVIKIVTITIIII